MTSSNSYDAIEQLIYDSGLRIISVASLTKHNLLVVFLSTGVSLSFPISAYKLLSTATQQQLDNYRLIAGGVGIHWPDVDEDLSLRGFLREQLKKLVGITEGKADKTPNYAMAS